MNEKEKVAILGAGPAGLAAAYGLSKTKAQREKYDVTVYQVGWRAGGKCSSGRIGVENRIEQNGTHFLFGCYDNTIGVTKEAYDTLEKAGIKEFGDYETSLLPRNLLALKHFFRGQWHMWAWPLPSNREEPGGDRIFLSPPAYLSMFLQFMITFIFGIRVGNWLRPPSPFDENRPALLRVIYAVLRPLVVVVAWIIWAIGLAVSRLIMDLLTLFGDPDFLFIANLLTLVRSINKFLFHKLAQRFLIFAKLFMIVDFGCTMGIALLRDKVPAKGLSAIEEFEFRGWLARHGAAEMTLWAPFVSTWYDAVAAFEDGDPTKPNLSAGVSMLAITRAVMTYKGHFAYQMRSEVGDTVIGPVVQMLRERGVKFRFFHKVQDVVPGEHNEITEIHVERQVELKSGDPDSYQPFDTVKGLNVWPDAPKWDQIKGKQPPADINLESFYTSWKGKMLKPLKKGVDFDSVVLAMPVASFPTYCAKIIDRSDRWRDMTDAMTGTETQTIRLYFKEDLKGLGWTLPTPILSNYAEPFTTWEDNGDLVSVETWPEGTAPGAIATLFGPLPAPRQSPPPSDTAYPEAQSRVAHTNALQYLEENIGALWPKAATLQNPLAVNWDGLVDLENRVGPARIAAQYIRANSGPLQRYTSARAGTAQHRIPADDTGFSNLTVAGDWTQNHFLIGSVEGAVMSGLQASRAISGYPHQIPGEDTGL